MDLKNSGHATDENIILFSRFDCLKYVSLYCLSNVEILCENYNCESNYWLITLRLTGDNVERLRNDILNDSHKQKIFLRPSWILLNELPMYKNSFCADISEAKNQSKRLINLPSSPKQLDDL